jgi:organic hydroperoxide reductase OsmC/OhrA
MPEFVFNGTASWRSETESDLTIKGKHVVTVSPPPEFGGKEGYIVPEEVFTASLASCMNTIFLLIARNSKLNFRNLETQATVKMDAEGLDKLIFTYIHFSIMIKLETDNERERKKVNAVYKIAQRICPLSQSWGDKVPITFELSYI